MKFLIIFLMIFNISNLTQAKEFPAVGVLSLAKVLDNIPQAKEINQVLEKINSDYQEQINNKIKDQQNLVASFEKNFKPILSEEGYEKKVQKDLIPKVETMSKEIQDLQEEASKKIQEKEAKLLDPLLNKIKEYIKKISKEKKIFMTIDYSSPVHFIENPIDLTEDIINHFKKEK